MTIDDNIKSEETKEAAKGTSGFNQWNVFFWKLIRSLVVIVAGMTVIYLVCRWLIY
jgi:hypothetical protein